LIIGEVGLTAEVRPISFCDRLVNEGVKMGFKNVVIPYRNKDKISNKGTNVILVSSLREAIGKVF
jgi:DNA repair protein RadA/Sms